MPTKTLYVTGNGGTIIGWNHEGVNPPDTHWDYVNDQPDPDGMTTRLYSPITGDTVTFTLDPLGETGVSINSVTVHTVVSKLDPVDAYTRAIIEIGGTLYEGADATPSTNNVFEDLSEVWTTNPATGSAWTASDIDALQVGLKKINPPGERVTQVYAVVDYQAAAAASPLTAVGGTLTLVGGAVT